MVTEYQIKEARVREIGESLQLEERMSAYFNCNKLRNTVAEPLIRKCTWKATGMYAILRSLRDEDNEVVLETLLEYVTTDVEEIMDAINELILFGYISEKVVTINDKLKHIYTIYDTCIDFKIIDMVDLKELGEV